VSQGESEKPEELEEDADEDWHQAYEALVLETFEAEEAILLLKLLEKPDLLRSALEYFAGGGDEGEEKEVAEDA
jgi:hypothetical protein